MTHPARLRQASELVARHPELDMDIVVAAPHRGSPTDTSRLAWRTADVSATHRVVIQDDVDLVAGIHDRVIEALTRYPDSVLAFFTEWGSRTAQAARLATLAGATWVEVVDDYVPTLAIAMPTPLAEEFDDFCASREVGRAGDAAMWAFLRHRRTRALVSVPNLAEHRELPSLVTNDLIQGPRRAVLFADRPGP